VFKALVKCILKENYMNVKILFVLLLFCLIRTTVIAQAPYLVKDIYSGKSSSQPGWFIDINGIVYFGANDGIHGHQLWKSDGTENGTMMIKQIPGNVSLQFLANINNSLLFMAYSQSGKGRIWKTDGTEAGTVLVKDLAPQASGASIYDTLTINNTLFFLADISSGVGLWRSDGTEAGTKLIKNIHAGKLFKINNTIFFIVRDDKDNGLELWKSDGTEAGTIRVKDVWSSEQPGINNFTEVDGTLFFSGYSDGVVWLFKSDTTSSERVKVKRLGIPERAYFTDFNGTLFFIGNDGSGLGIWKTDGSETGTVRVLDNNNMKLSTISLLKYVNNTLFFVAADESGASKLWKTDGTTLESIVDVYPGAFSGSSELVVVDTILFFTASHSFNSTSLWKSDGTTIGTNRIDTGEIVVSHLIATNNKLFFAGTNNSKGTELWAVDIVGSTGVTEHNKSGKKFDISPNPFDVTTTVTINSDNSDKTVFILYNSLGNQVRKFTATTPDFTIERGELSDGIYTLQWIDGNSTISRRVVIMR
jgi:ELWxxDGT repeat protein